MKTNGILDLEKFRTQLGNVKSKVFTGRDRGLDVRKRSSIDSIFDNNEIVTIIIPKDIYSITPSFLEELFYNIVSKYGKSKFLEKVQWDSNGYDINGPLEEAIERILQRKTGLD